MLTSITGKTVVVTGGSKGIGKGIAEVFARQQTNVLVVSRHLDEAQAVAESIGPQAAGFACDVSDWDACQALAAEAEPEDNRPEIVPGIKDPFAKND